MTWDEWEHLKASAAERQSPHTHLDQVAADSGGGSADSGDLVVHQDDLGAVGHEAHVLYDHVRAQADIAGAGADKSGAGTTMRAAAELKSHGLAIGGALETTVTVWTSQVDSVLQACAHVSNHLDYSRKRHAEDDETIAAAVRERDGSALSVSQLDQYFE
ncbi:hypothetical protein [Streptomyces mangrovisoli]|uniref:AG1 protein n=1 Tax=Streptomyces mangrovisoli TaxID=1428628 RepID=A0A1J4NU75_9ACTN|nr:hypothetical protein [Streptomyces mangrovisoli]OIJ65650.1 hypothetical protein WN71_022460 [Streptomyces mangrovisoli]